MTRRIEGHPEGLPSGLDKEEPIDAGELRILKTRLEAAQRASEALWDGLAEAAEVMAWLSKHEPDCYGWAPPYPSVTPAIKLQAERAWRLLADHASTQNQTAGEDADG